MPDDISQALRAKLETDPFARFLGATLLEARPGFARMALDVRPEHGSVPGVTHGGVVFALAEAALAAATHAHNAVHLALSVTVNFHASTQPGDRLVAEVQKRHDGKRTASYGIEVRDQNDRLIASFLAVVYRTGTPVLPD